MFITGSNLDAYGLQNPEIIFPFYPHETDKPDSLEPLETLYVGNMLPSRYTYYTLLDGDTELFLVPRYFVTMVLALAFGEDQIPTPLPRKVEPDPT